MMEYTIDIIIAVCTVIGTALAISKILSKKFDKIDERFDKVDNEIKEIKKDIGDMKVQLGKLETRVDERTFRVKYIRTGTEEEN
jgi:archaellum component FlaC